MTNTKPNLDEFEGRKSNKYKTETYRNKSELKMKKIRFNSELIM